MCWGKTPPPFFRIFDPPRGLGGGMAPEKGLKRRPPPPPAPNAVGSRSDIAFRFSHQFASSFSPAPF